MPIVVERQNHAYMEGSTLAHDALKDVTLTIGDGEFLWVDWAYGKRKVYVCAAFERPFAANFRKCDGGWL